MYLPFQKYLNIQKIRNQNRWKSKIWWNRYLFQCESRVSALSEPQPWIHRTYSRKHNDAKLDCFLFQSVWTNPALYNDAALQHGGKTWFSQVAARQAKCAVALRFALCVFAVAASKPLWIWAKNFSGHFHTNVTARQPAARLPGPGEVDRNGQEYAHLHPTTLSVTCQRLVFISIIPWPSGGALLLFLSASIKQPLHLGVYIIHPINNININNNNKR